MREIRTAGSDWGDEHKRSCRLGEVAGAKAPLAARLRKGYRFKARLYHPVRLFVPDWKTHPRFRAGLGIAAIAARSLAFSAGLFFEQVQHDQAIALR